MEYETNIKFDEDTKKKYLEALAQVGTYTHAAKAAEISYATVKAHRDKYELFAEAEAEALFAYRESLEAELHDRVFNGVERPIFQNGMQVGTEHQKSDRLLELALRSRDDKYKPNVKVDAEVKAGGALVIENPSPLSPEEWEKQYGEQAKGNGVEGSEGEPGSVSE